MDKSITVGLNIFSILSDALYQDPRMLFREYFQNSIDSAGKVTTQRNIKIEALIISEGKIISLNDFKNHPNLLQSKFDLVFTDTGDGVAEEEFENLVGTIALSSKVRENSIGYMGIGRLSGYSYCDSIEYLNIKNDNLVNQLSLAVGKIRAAVDNDDQINNITSFIKSDMNESEISLYDVSDGFVVILRNISLQLINFVTRGDFLNEMQKSIKCKVICSDDTNSNVKLFFEELNSQINYTLKIGGETLERKYDIDSTSEQDCLIKITDELDNTVAYTIKKISNEISNSARRHLDKGIRVYYKGMLINQDLEIVKQIRLYTGYEKSESEMALAFNAFYYEVHLVSDQLKLLASRTWVSMREDHAHVFLEHLKELHDNSYSLRYLYSKLKSHYKKEGIDKTSAKSLKDKRTKLELEFSQLIGGFQSDDSITEDQILKQILKKDLSPAISDKKILHDFLLSKTKRKLSEYINLNYAKKMKKDEHYKEFIEMLIEDN